MREITLEQLPPEAREELYDVSTYQFWIAPNDTIHAFYGGDPVAVWNGTSWNWNAT